MTNVDEAYNKKLAECRKLLRTIGEGLDDHAPPEGNIDWTYVGDVANVATKLQEVHNFLYNEEEDSVVFTINDEKLAAVTRIMNRDVDPEVTEELVEIEICADWNEGAEHQAWIDHANPDEIVNWLASFYEPAEDN